MSTQSLLLPIEGEFVVEPVIRLQPTVQRASSTADVGWTYRRRYTLTNTGSEPVLFHPHAINIGATNGLVSGSKLQADGDDLRAWIGGREIARSINTINSATDCLVWILIPYLGAGAAMDVDIVYGNASATTPPALTAGVDLPAFDVATTGTRSTNATWIYQIDDTAAHAGKGGWRLDATTGQPNWQFGVPGAWQLINTLSTDDDRRQEAYSDYVDTDPYVRAIFDATRARNGTLLLGQNNGADGVGLRVPVGIESVRCGFLWTNMAQGDTVATPVGKLVIVTRNTPVEAWKTLYSNNALQATEDDIAVATYTPAAAVKEVAFAVWPYEGNNITLGAKPDRFVHAQWDTTLEVNLDDSVITQSGGSEVEIYELASMLRYGGGGDTAGVPPYKEILLGNADSASGAGTPRLAVEIDQQVLVKTAERKVEVWNSGLTAFVEDAPLPAVNAVDGVRDSSGATIEQRSADWMPLMPMVNPLANPSAETDATGWTRGDVTTDVTVGSVSRTTGTFDSTPASFTATITANTSGTGGTVEEIADDYLPVGARENVQVGVAIRTADVDVQPTPAIWFYDAAQSLIGSRFVQADWTIPAINTWYRRLFAAAVPDGAAYFRVGIVAKSKTSNQTGQYWWDTVEVNDTEIAFSDVSKGTIVLAADWINRRAFA